MGAGPARDLLLAIALATLGCSSSGDASGAGGAAGSAGASGSGGTAGAAGDAGTSIYEQDGPYAVGHMTFPVTDSARGRTLLVTVWYPADDSARAAASTGEPIENLVPAGADRDTYKGLLDAAPADCPSHTSHSAPDAPLAASATSLPLIAFSHCHNCVRFSEMSVAERLASHGFAVAAPDHTDNTVFDQIAGTSASLSTAFLQTRAADISFVLDQLLDGSATAVPDALRGHFDATRVGVFGHSFGGVTTGLVLENDPRPLAGLSIAAPAQSPLPSGVDLSRIHKPLLFIVAKEDHSIGEIGNGIIRDNFAQGNPPLWKLEVADAGHWSFSDICALTSGFSACCGTAQRQTDSSQSFSYLPVATGKAIAQAYVTAFFSGELLGDAAGLDYVRAAHPAALVEAAARE